jgi:hypothetical protein
VIDRTRLRSSLAILGALTAVGFGLALGARVAAAPPAAASTAEDGANWVPFIGDHELWCTQGNPGFSGCQSHHTRPAMDIGMPVGTTIRAAGAGVVDAAGNDGDGRGTYVQIEHAGGRESHYYHLSSLSVGVGQSVEAGQVIGESGLTGVNSSAPHLHYEEKSASGATVEPGVMHSIQDGQLVDYPTAGGSSSWLEVPYGTRIVNEGYEVSPFSDVTLSTWNYVAIDWAVEDGIAAGFGDDTWRNGTELNRAQAVMWIWSSTGSPEAAGTASHPDVSPSAWYRDGIDWAAGVTGMLDQFGPNFEVTTPITRGELAVMAWVRAGKPPAPSSLFTDVADADERAAADWMAARGYMTGYEDDTFRPDNTITRGEAIMALWRERLFDDVNATAWNRPAIDWARWRAFMVGFPDHTFRSPNAITRAQTAVLIWRAAGSPPAVTSAGFTDTAGTWYETAADWAAENAIATGYPKDDTFRGDNPITRAAFVMMLWRRAGEPDPGGPHSFSDVSESAWYDEGATWAGGNGVVTGIGGEFRGLTDITRGQTVNSFALAVALPA